MPKPYSFPLLINEAEQICINSLIKNNQLLEGQTKQITRTWTYSYSGHKNSISIFTNLSNRYIRISYTLNRTDEIDYKVEITSMPSNIGNGVVYYFVCPATGKRCRKLYFNGTYYVSRYAINNGCYEGQQYSKQNRKLCRIISIMHDADNASIEIESKHFKKFYDGKPTKKYLKLLKVIEKGERYPPGTIELLLSGIIP